MWRHVPVCLPVEPALPRGTAAPGSELPVSELVSKPTSVCAGIVGSRNAFVPAASISLTAAV